MFARMGVTLAGVEIVVQYVAQASMSIARLAKRSPRRYAASTLLGSVCDIACSITSWGKEFKTASDDQSRNVERNP